VDVAAVDGDAVDVEAACATRTVRPPSPGPMGYEGGVLWGVRVCRTHCASSFALRLRSITMSSLRPSSTLCSPAVAKPSPLHNPPPMDVSLKSLRASTAHGSA
jgi:hypothetical protein